MTPALGNATSGTIVASGLITANANLTIGNGATTAGVLTLLEDTDAGSNFASFQVPALAANTVYVLPADDGDAGEQLQTDGSGNLTWESAGGAAGANAALSNLSSVAINTALILGTSDTAALGSATKMWSDLFLADGGVINWNAGNFTLTHSTGKLLADGVISATGFRINDVAGDGRFMVGNGVDFYQSNFAIPTSIGSTGTFWQSDGTLIGNSAYTLPSTINTAGTFLQSDGGTNIVLSGTITDGEGVQLNDTTFMSAPLRTLPQGRLTLTTALPVTTADVTAATTLYFTPYKGDVIPLFDGTRWKLQTFTEKSIRVTDATSTGASYGNGLNTISDLSDTSQLVKGMTITSSLTGIGALTIATIVNSTQITMSGNATSTQSGATITFKLPASKNYDVFYVQGSGKLEFSNAWTSDTARADALALQNGIYVNNANITDGTSTLIAAKTGTYLGTIRTTATAGQVEDSLTKRYIWNNYNRVNRKLLATDGTDSWTYNSTTWRQANATTTNQIDIIIGLAEDAIDILVRTLSTSDGSVGVGVNSTSALSGQMSFASGTSTSSASYSAVPAIGYTYYAWLERRNSSSVTFYGDNADSAAWGTSGISALISM